MSGEEMLADIKASPKQISNTAEVTLKEKERIVGVHVDRVDLYAVQINFLILDESIMT